MAQVVLVNDSIILIHSHILSPIALEKWKKVDLMIGTIDNYKIRYSGKNHKIVLWIICFFKSQLPGCATFHLESLFGSH